MTFGELGANVAVGAFTAIGEDVVIGDDVVLYPNVTIEPGCVIGDRTIIYPQVSVYYGSRIGRRCILHSGVVIGSDGYGFATDENGIHHKIRSVDRAIEDRRSALHAVEAALARP